MIQLAISILWLVLGIVVLLGVVYLALYVVRLFTAIPDPIEKMVWAITLILILIAVLTLLANGGHLRLGAIAPAAALLSAPA